MNFFDQSILNFIGQFARHSELFDSIVVNIANNELFKGGILSIIIWWLWFSPSVEQKKVRVALISTLLGSLVAVFFARILPLTLPYRQRPNLRDDIGFIAPYHSEGLRFDHLTSFPSDHATLLFGLAIGIYFASKNLGRWVLLYTLLFIGLPRVYLGLHYPTDVLCGALLGMLVIYLANKPWFVNKISLKVYELSEKQAPFFYATFFLITYQISDLFMQLRNLARALINLIS